MPWSCGDSPMMSWKRRTRVRTWSLRDSASWSRLRFSSALDRVTSTWSASSGLSRKLSAPDFIASTAISTLAKAVIMTNVASLPSSLRMVAMARRALSSSSTTRIRCADMDGGSEVRSGEGDAGEGLRERRVWLGVGARGAGMPRLHDGLDARRYLDDGAGEAVGGQLGEDEPHHLRVQVRGDGDVGADDEVGEVRRLAGAAHDARHRAALVEEDVDVRLARPLQERQQRASLHRAHQQRLRGPAPVLRRAGLDERQTDGNGRRPVARQYGTSLALPIQARFVLSDGHGRHGRSFRRALFRHCPFNPCAAKVLHGEPGIRPAAPDGRARVAHGSPKSRSTVGPVKLTSRQPANMRGSPNLSSSAVSSPSPAAIALGGVLMAKGMPNEHPMATRMGVDAEGSTLRARGMSSAAVPVLLISADSPAATTTSAPKRTSRGHASIRGPSRA